MAETAMLSHGRCTPHPERASAEQIAASAQQLADNAETLTRVTAQLTVSG
jgi:methyl-accepting chemotaxis protein